jgi:hypothetical protein
MDAITDFIRERVAQISSQKEFDKYILNVKTSTAPIEQREEVIRYAEARHPEYSSIDTSPTEEILKQIKEGSADIGDMEGF